MKAQKGESVEISNLLSNAKTQAGIIADDADTLEAYTMSSMSWETHAVKLREMAEHVNSLGKIDKQLNDIRSEGAPWQKDAIDSIHPLLRQLADVLTSTINHLNKNENNVNMPPYRDYAHANADLASRLSSVVSDSVAYNRAMARSKGAERGLEAPPQK
jgi:hypothetical protein